MYARSALAMQGLRMLQTMFLALCVCRICGRWVKGRQYTMQGCVSHEGNTVVAGVTSRVVCMSYNAGLLWCC